MPFWKKKENPWIREKNRLAATGLITPEEYDELIDLHYRYGSRSPAEQERYFELDEKWRAALQELEIQGEDRGR